MYVIWLNFDVETLESHMSVLIKYCILVVCCHIYQISPYFYDQFESMENMWHI
jgi:hypothetical protein